MDKNEIKIPPIGDCSGLGMYLMFLLSGSMFSKSESIANDIPEEIKKKAHELAKETKRKMDNGEFEKFDPDGELATDNELFKAYTEDLLRLVTLSHIERYTSKCYNLGLTSNDDLLINSR